MPPGIKVVRTRTYSRLFHVCFFKQNYLHQNISCLLFNAQNECVQICHHRVKGLEASNLPFFHLPFSTSAKTPSLPGEPNKATAQSIPLISQEYFITQTEWTAPKRGEPNSLKEAVRNSRMKQKIQGILNAFPALNSAVEQRMFLRTETTGCITDGPLPTEVQTINQVAPDPHRFT